MRKSVLESDDYLNMPYRDQYADSALLARMIPGVPEVSALETVLNEMADAILTGSVSVEEGLANAQKRLEDFISMMGQ